MSGKSLTLLLILGFVTLTLGSFIWFVVAWESDSSEPVSRLDRIEREGS